MSSVQQQEKPLNSKEKIQFLKSSYLQLIAVLHQVKDEMREMDLPSYVQEEYKKYFDELMKKSLTSINERIEQMNELLNIHASDSVMDAFLKEHIQEIKCFLFIKDSNNRRRSSLSF